jgi:hypothetical protein
VILNHGFWLRAFGGRDSVVNETIVLNGEPYTIIGVMHPNWRFGGHEISVFTPRMFSDSDLQSRGAHFMNVIGRPDVSIDGARAELAIAGRLESQYPDGNKGWHRRQLLLDAAVGDFRPTHDIARRRRLVLLVACANLANMHWRATGRARK